MKRKLPRRIDPVAFAKSIGQRLHAARLAASKRVDECAKAVGRSESTWRRWERGQALPTPDVTLAGAHFVGVTLEHLLGNPSTRGR